MLSDVGPVSLCRSDGFGDTGGQGQLKGASSWMDSFEIFMALAGSRESVPIVVFVCVWMEVINVFDFDVVRLRLDR